MSKNSLWFPFRNNFWYILWGIAIGDNGDGTKLSEFPTIFMGTLLVVDLKLEPNDVVTREFVIILQ